MLREKLRPQIHFPKPQAISLHLCILHLPCAELTAQHFQRVPQDPDSKKIHNQIRAFDPYPGAYSFINGKRIKLFSSLRIENNKNYINAKPGQLIIDGDFLFIKANKGIVCVSDIQLEGKNKMSANQFIKTLHNKIYILD